MNEATAQSPNWDRALTMKPWELHDAWPFSEGLPPRNLVLPATGPPPYEVVTSRGRLLAWIDYSTQYTGDGVRWVARDPHTGEFFTLFTQDIAGWRCR